MEEEKEIEKNVNNENICVSISNVILGVIRKKIYVYLKTIYDFDKNIRLGVLSFIYDDPSLRIKSNAELSISDAEYVLKHIENIISTEKEIIKFPPPEIIIKSGDIKVFFKYQTAWTFGISVENYAIDNLVFSEIKELLSYLKSGCEKIKELK